MQPEITEPSTTVSPKTNPEQARASATDFLLDHLGNQLAAGQPHFAIVMEHAWWIVPIELGYIHTSILGTVGVIAVDNETSQIEGWTPISQRNVSIG